MLDLESRPATEGLLHLAFGTVVNQKENKNIAEPTLEQAQTVQLVSRLNTTNFYSRILSEFRLNNILCDIAFTFPNIDVEIKAHRVVLACHSEFFRSKFVEAQNKGTELRTFLIEKATPYVFNFALEFMYSGKIQVPRNILLELYKVAHEYQMAELQALCIHTLSESLAIHPTYNYVSEMSTKSEPQSVAPMPENMMPKPTMQICDPKKPKKTPASSEGLKLSPSAENDSKAQIKTASTTSQYAPQLNLLVLAQQALLEKNKNVQDENQNCNTNVKKSTNRTDALKICCVDGCGAFARTTSKYCINHGSKICAYPNCFTGARGGSKFCVTHGGGRRCAVPNCNTSARGRSKLCILHGGGKRCSVRFCKKSARGGSQKCISHGGGRLCDNAECSNQRKGGSKYCDVHAGEKETQKETTKRTASGTSKSRKRSSLEDITPLQEKDGLKLRKRQRVYAKPNKRPLDVLAL